MLAKVHQPCVNILRYTFDRCNALSSCTCGKLPLLLGTLDRSGYHCSGNLAVKVFVMNSTASSCCGGDSGVSVCVHERLRVA